MKQTISLSTWLLPIIILCLCACQKKDAETSAQTKKQATKTALTTEKASSDNFDFSRLDHLPNARFRKVFTFRDQTGYNNNIWTTISRYDSDAQILIIKEEELPSVIRLVKTHMLFDADTKEVVKVEQKILEDEKDEAMGRHSADVDFTLSHYLISFSDNASGIQGARETKQASRDEDRISVDKTFEKMSTPMKTITDPAKYLNADYWTEQAHGALDATPVTTWVDKVNLRFEPELDGEDWGKTIPQGTVLAWTGEISENTSTVKLRGKKYTDHWYEMLPLHPEMGKVWVFGGVIKKPGEIKEGKTIVSKRDEEEARPTQYSVKSNTTANISHTNKKGRYRIQLGVFSGTKSGSALDRSFGFTKLGMDNFRDVITHDFKRIDGTVCRRYYYGFFNSRSDAEAMMRDLESVSGKDLMVVRK